ncbi:unnamed protein product [Urochloa humidicola]
MAASTRTLFLSCFHGGGAEVSLHLALRPRYPSMPRRPRTASVAGDAGEAGGSGGGDLEAAKGAAEKAEDDEEEKVAVFEVTGMSCAACAGSVEKAVKRLPGIHDAAVDVLGGRAQVVFYPAFVSEEKIREAIEDVGFEAKLINEEVREKNILVSIIISVQPSNTHVDIVVFGRP